jgi:hypothetical protein
VRRQPLARDLLAAGIGNCIALAVAAQDSVALAGAFAKR